MRDARISAWGAAAALAAMTIGCRVGDEARRAPAGPALTGAVPPCLVEGPGPEPHECPVHSCGNAATINNAIVEALDTRGQEVQDLKQPFRIRRGSLTGGGCRGVPGLSLEVRDGGFVGVLGAEVKCSGAELVGARFDLVQGGPFTTPVVATVAIRERGTVATAPDEAGASETLPTYDLVLEPRPGLPTSLPRHLCRRAPWTEPGIPGADSGTYHALLIQGEIYRADATVSRRGPHWFNIGCAGSGISKMRLHGFDPMKHREASEPAAPGASTVAERQATLKMLTGKYCGAASWTEDGTRIQFHHRSGRAARDPIRPGQRAERAGPIESRWGASGALCVSHLRLWSAASACAKWPEADWVQRVRRACKIPACDESLPCNAASETGEAIWRTCTVDHVPHAGP